MSIRTVWELGEVIESEINAEVQVRVMELAPDDENFDEFRPLYLSVIRELMDNDGFIADIADGVVPVYTYDIFTLAADSLEIQDYANDAMEGYNTVESALACGIYDHAFYLASAHLAALEEQYTD